VLLFSVWLCFFVRDDVRASSRSRKPLRLASRLAMVSMAAAGGSG